MPHRFSVDNLFLSERQRPHRLCKQLEAFGANGRLAGSRAKERTGHADDVSEVEVRQHPELLFSELVLPEVELNAATRVREVRERRLPMRAPRDDSAGDRDAGSFLVRGRSFGWGQQGERFRRRMLARIGVRKRIYRCGTKRFQFFAPCLQNEIQIVCHCYSCPPDCFKYASMKGSIPPSITFCTSGIFSSVLWSFTIVYG